MKKKLIMFTVGFPFGDTEASFLTNELKIISNYFDVVNIIPMQSFKSDFEIIMPENVFIEANLFEKNLYSVNNKIEFSSFFSILFSEFIYSRRYLKFTNNFRYHLSQLKSLWYKSFVLKNYLIKNNIDIKNTVFYTYWFDEWTSIISLIKKFHKGFEGIRLISRAHRFDLYNYANESGYIFPRKIQFQCADSVVSISDDGKQYLQNTHPKYKEKISFSRLGVNAPPKEKNGISFNRYEDEFLIVSCSTVKKIKRVFLIAKLLKRISSKIRWVHFGDGDLMSSLRDEVDKLPINIQVDLKGFSTNENVLNFYKKNRVDIFVNVSESEGIPVSIMEAISFGIPILATNVGGTSEIVNEATGLLIDENFDCDEI